MNEKEIERLYAMYLDTAKRCSSDILTLDQEEIEYNLFEEFDVGVRSFFHDVNLGRLLEAGMIDAEAAQISRELRRQWLVLDDTRWTIKEIKSHPDWKRLFSSCDRLLAVLDQ